MLQGAGEGLPACPPWALAHRQAGDTPFPLPGGEGEDGEAQGGCPRGAGGEGTPRAVPQCRGSPQFSAYVRGAKGKGARGRWGRPRRKEPGLGEAEQPGLHALVVLWGEGRVLGGAELPPPRRLPSPAGQPWLPRTKLPLPEQGRTC